MDGAVQIDGLLGFHLERILCHRWESDGELGFVPDQYLGEGDEVDAAKRGLREGYARLAEELEPENLLLAHGEPVIGGGTEALRRFAAG